MPWASPAYSRTKIDEAGDSYITPNKAPGDRELALTIINNWRSSHGFPLNTLQVNLRRQSATIDDDPTVAQRIKRIQSIRHKLERFPGMKLSRMQDLGGCRAVLSSVQGVDELVAYYKTHSRMKHKLVRENQYILEPKQSGYRGVHLVYRYFSDRETTWNGLNIEVQIRSRLQHAWATAVETVGTFTQQALKSSWGDQDWLRFFALMGSAHAFRERTPLVPDSPDDPDAMVRELRELVKKLDVIRRLTAYGEAVELVEPNKGQTFLLELDISDKKLVARSFKNRLAATEAYSEAERAIENEAEKDAVLVSVESVAALRRAYPNYFLDTRAFLESVEEAIG